MEIYFHYWFIVDYNEMILTNDQTAIYSLTRNKMNQ